MQQNDLPDERFIFPKFVSASQPKASLMLCCKNHLHNLDKDYNVPIQLPHVQEEEKNMKWWWWLLLLALLAVVIIGGAYWRWEFWSGVF